MDNSPPNDECSRTRQFKEFDDSEYLLAQTFKGHALTRAKKLRSPVRSNESSTSMPTPIQALVVDIEGPTSSHHEDIDDDDEDEDEDDEYDDDDNENDEYEDEDEFSSSGSSTPKASRQSFGTSSSPAYGSNSPAYVVERPSTPRASRQLGDQSYRLSPTLPAVAYSPPAGYHSRRRQYHRGNESISSMGTVRPAQSEQAVLDAMIDNLRGAQRRDGDEDDDVLNERGLELKPARSLRRERRGARN